MGKAVRVFAFGPFRFFPTHGTLLKDNTPVRPGGRALAILRALLERSGELVTKEYLLAYAWPKTRVDGTNLRIHIAELRRLLGNQQSGAQYIVNEVGRGYRFVAPLDASIESPRTAVAIAEAKNTDDLPANLKIGRSTIVRSLTTQLRERRLVTIVGPGGIGKTTVALEAARELTVAHANGVRFVDLAPLNDPGLAPSAIGSALGIAIRSENPIPDIVAFLQSTQMLLVLDGCERIVDAMAKLVEALLKSSRACTC